jgi:hypothetical protein
MGSWEISGRCASPADNDAPESPKVFDENAAAARAWIEQIVEAAARLPRKPREVALELMPAVGKLWRVMTAISRSVKEGRNEVMAAADELEGIVPPLSAPGPVDRRQTDFFPGLAAGSDREPGYGEDDEYDDDDDRDEQGAVIKP